jgi:hypothetical protein
MLKKIKYYYYNIIIIIINITIIKRFLLVYGTAVVSVIPVAISL